MVQKTIIDTLHKEVTEGHYWKGWLFKKFCIKAYSIAKLTSRGVDWSWSQCIKSHHAQTSSGKGLPSHFWNRNVFFSGESKFSISFGNQGPRVWRKSGEAQNPFCLKSSVKFPQSCDDLGCHIICWCWSTVFSEVHSQCSHLPGHFRALHASFCWQALWRCWFHFPAGLGTCPHIQRCQKLVQWPWCYCAWLASKLAWPEPHRASMGYCPEEDERNQTLQCRWPEGRYQINLGFHYTWAVPQADCLHCHAAFMQ